MTMVRPLWEYVRTQARLRPDALAVHGPAGPTRYATLVAEVEALATELLEQGLSPRDMVGLHFGFSHLHLLLILALDRLSIPSMSFAVGDPSQAPILDPRFRLTTVISGIGTPADVTGRWIRMTEPDRPRPGAIDADRLARLDSPPDALVRVAWSSGTAGGAKGVAFTRALQAERMIARRLLRGIGPRVRFFPGFPFSAVTTYNTLLTVLSAGGAIVLPSPAPNFIALANALGVTLTNAPPSMLATLIEGAGAAPSRLETIQVFEVAGAQLPSGLARRAFTALTPHLMLVYGATEAGRIAIADAALAIADPTAAGFVTPGVGLQIVDPSDRPLAAGTEGLVRIRGPQVATGYFEDPAATARNFRDGWFYPGDLGVLTADGLVHLTGRVEDMIRQDGALVSPLPIEAALRDVAGVGDVAVFALPEADGAVTVCAALVLAPGAAPAIVRADAAARLGDSVPQRLFVVERLPRNANGKVVRRELAEMARRERLT